MIDPNELNRHLSDYAEVFGRNTSDFVCPITLRSCSTTDLINGHILNQSFIEAERRQIIQCRDVDNFYGNRVEPELVRHLNSTLQSKSEILKASNGLSINFADGSKVDAFYTSGKAARGAAQKYPIVDVHVAEDELVPIFLKASFDDPRLQQIESLSGFHIGIPSHWAAGMLKAGFLALYDLIGYRVVNDPMGHTLRVTLTQYFRDNGTRSDAGIYFKDFVNSVKIIGVGSSPQDFRADYKVYSFDSLTNRMLLLHYAGNEQVLMFAATVVFKINKLTVTITLPQSLGGANVAVVWELYQRLLNDANSVKQGVYRARYKDKQWLVETTPQRFHYLE